MARRVSDRSLSVARRPAAPPGRGLGRSIYRHYEWRDFPWLDNISLAADAATLSPVALFIQADIIVKAVMIGLLLASIYVWMVIFTHGRGVSKLMSASERFERDFWRADNIDKFFDKNSDEEDRKSTRLNSSH